MGGDNHGSVGTCPGSAVLLSSQIPGRVNALGPLGLALDESRVQIELNVLRSVKKSIKPIFRYHQSHAVSGANAMQRLWIPIFR